MGLAARRPHNGSPDTSTDSNGEGERNATFGDVITCYRLLLGRQPDADGLAHYRQRMTAGPLTLDELVSEFLGSVEFVRRQAERPTGEGCTGETVQTCEGFQIRVDPADYAVGHTVARTGSYEPDVSATLRQLLRPGGTFVDIGANIGWFSLLAASVVGPGGRVIAVEPNPHNVALLERSAKENGFANIEVLAVAVADRTGAVALETDGSNGRVIPIDGAPPVPVPASFVVAAEPLDALLGPRGLDRLDLVKIDVEGAEPLVLRGGGETLSRHRPRLVSEFFPRALDSSPWGSAAGYLKSLRRLGYSLSVIGNSPPGTALDDESIMELACAAGRDQVDLLAMPL